RVHTRLKAYLDALPIDVGLLVPGPAGKAWDPSAFSKALRAHLDACGLTEVHFHGLRHNCATTLADAGSSEKEIMAVTGHKTSDMVKRYTKRAEQKRLAHSAIEKVEAAERESNTQVVNPPAASGKSKGPSRG